MYTARVSSATRTVPRRSRRRISPATTAACSAAASPATRASTWCLCTRAAVHRPADGADQEQVAVAHARILQRLVRRQAALLRTPDQEHLVGQVGVEVEPVEH